MKIKKLAIDIKTNTVGNIFVRALLWFTLVSFTVFTILPLVWLAYSSVKPQLEIITSPLALPKEPTLSNFSNAWVKGNLGTYFFNSILYTAGTSISVSIFGMMASFAFVKFGFKISGLLKGFFLIGIFITLQTILIPLFLFESKVIRIIGTHWGILIPYIGISLPLAIYLGTTYLQSMPNSVIESAKIDGAGYLTIFFRLVFPMSQPVIATIVIMTTLSIWNEFMLVFVLSNESKIRSLPVGIYSFSGPLATEYGMQFAALIIGLIPMLIFYAFFRKKITAGFVAGAVKE